MDHDPLAPEADSEDWDYYVPGSWDEVQEARATGLLTSEELDAIGSAARVHHSATP